ncbi:YggT family protein [Candidatus Auribacterota bacterium]
MNLIDIILNVLILLFILRYLANTLGSSSLGYYYQHVITITEPILKYLRRFRLKSKRDLSPLLGILSCLALKTLFYVANPSEMAEIQLVFTAIYFKNIGLMGGFFKSILMLLLFCHRVLSFLLILSSLLNLKNSFEPFLRIADCLTSPIYNLTLKIFRLYSLSFRYQAFFSLITLSLLFSALVNLILFLSQGTVVLASFGRTLVQVNFLQLFWSSMGITVEIFYLFIVLMIIRAISSWFISPYENKLIQLICIITEPLTAPFERLNLNLGFIDLSLMVALFFWIFIHRIMMWIIASAYIYF